MISSEVSTSEGCSETSQMVIEDDMVLIATAAAAAAEHRCFEQNKQNGAIPVFSVYAQNLVLS